jgi:GT2 family glycosyltransferase
VISAVILAHRRRAALERVLARLGEHPVEEILIVDNGCDLPEIDRPGVRVLRPGRNIGVAGRNLAAREARGDLLLMLDDDSYPLPGAVETLSAVFVAQPRLGVAGGFVRDVDEQGRVLRQTEVGTFDWFFRGGRPAAAPPEGVPAFFFPEGASMVRRAALLDVGGFFEPFFFQAAEVDLTTRLLARGWDVRYVPAARFDHLKDPGGRLALQGQLRLRVRNQLWYFWLHFPARLALSRSLAYLGFDLIECSYRGVPGAWTGGIRAAWVGRDVVRTQRRPLTREVLRRAELDRGRLHMRLLIQQARLKMRKSARRVLAPGRAARRPPSGRP